MKEKLIARLSELGLTIGSCESFTGGLFCATLTSVPHASAVVRGGIITYATDIKTDVVGVHKEVISTYGVISEECAIEMAKQAQKLLACDICVSFTGNAGPGCMENKPAGTVYCAIVYQNTVKGYCLQFDCERNQVREKAVHKMMEEVMLMFQ